MSRVTIQIYLNGSDSDILEGGATRFWSPGGSNGEKPKFLDVVPKTGRALIFQQRGLLHSGETVHKGLKYTLRTDFMFEQVVDESSEILSQPDRGQDSVQNPMPVHERRRQGTFLKALAQKLRTLLQRLGVRDTETIKGDDRAR